MSIKKQEMKSGCQECEIPGGRFDDALIHMWNPVRIIRKEESDR